MQCLDGPGRPYSLPPLTTPRCANKRGPPAGPPAPTLMAFYHPLPFLVGLAPAAFHSSPGKRRLGEGGSPGLRSSEDRKGAQWGSPDPKCLPSSPGRRHSLVLVSYFGFYCQDVLSV